MSSLLAEAKEERLLPQVVEEEDIDSILMIEGKDIEIDDLDDSPSSP